MQLTFFRGLPVHSIACGDFHMLGLAMDWTVYAWGYGAEGQCGLGTTLHLRYVLSSGYVFLEIFAIVSCWLVHQSIPICSRARLSHVLSVLFVSVL